MFGGCRARSPAPNLTIAVFESEMMISLRKPLDSTTGRRASFAALFVILAGLMFASTGCSSTATPASAAETVRLASQKTDSADSVSFEMKVAVSGLGGGNLEMSANGVYDLEASQMQMAMDLFGQKTETVLDGTTVYLKMPLLGESWFKVDAEDAFEQAGGGLNGVLGQQDPTKILNWLSAVGDDVSRVGSDQVRGEDADHYRATLNLRKATAELSGEQADGIDEVLGLIGQDEFPIDVWVNKQGFPVRLTYEMSFAHSEVKAMQSAAVTYSLEYFDWGKPVTVTVPDRADVKELKQP